MTWVKEVDHPSSYAVRGTLNDAGQKSAYGKSAAGNSRRLYAGPAFEKTSTGGSYVSPGAGIHPKATPLYRIRSNGRTSGYMTSWNDIFAKCTV
jgi:hypothetical protein